MGKSTRQPPSSAFCFLPRPRPGPLPTAFCFLPSAYCLLLSAFSTIRRLDSPRYIPYPSKLAVTCQFAHLIT